MNYPGRLHITTGWLDPHQTTKLREDTSKRYKKAGSPFSGWLLHHQMSPETAQEWDAALVEFKNVAELRLSDFEALVAAVEHVFPQYSGQLKWAKKVLAGWKIDHEAAHTVPIGMNPTCLAATHMSTDGMPRLGVGMLLQRCRGLRPREMLELLPDHFVLPPGEQHLTVNTYIVVNLGVKQGTKIKRPQSSVLRYKQFPQLFKLILCLLMCTPRGQKIFPYSYSQYSKALNLEDWFPAAWLKHPY